MSVSAWRPRSWCAEPISPSWHDAWRGLAENVSEFARGAEENGRQGVRVFRFAEGARDHCERGAHTVFHARAFGWADGLIEPARVA